jgi:hypothetical protein
LSPELLERPASKDGGSRYIRNEEEKYMYGKEREREKTRLTSENAKMTNILWNRWNNNKYRYLLCKFDLHGTPSYISAIGS